MNQQVITWLWTSVVSAGWAPASVFVIHVVISRGLGAYLTLPDLDIPMHFAGGVAIAYFLWRSINIDAAGPVLGSLTLFARLLLTFLAVCAAAVYQSLDRAKMSSLQISCTLCSLSL